MNKIKDLVVKYAPVGFFFIACFIVSVLSLWIENYFLNQQYPGVIKLYDYTLKGIGTTIFSNFLENLFYYIIIVISYEVFNLKWYSILVVSAVIIVLGIVMSYLIGFNLILDVNSYRWYDRIFYIVVMSSVVYFFYRSPERIYNIIFVFFVIQMGANTLQYFAIGISTSKFCYYLNIQQFRFFIYSLAFGGIYLLSKSFIRIKNK